MSIDPSRWAVVAHHDDSAFGWMAADLKAVLGINRHLVIPSERLWDKPLHSPDQTLLSPLCSPAELADLMQGLEGIIFFERYWWHPELLTTAKKLNITTVCVPTWEWFCGVHPAWKLCDLFICPSQFALSVVQSYGWRNSVHLPWALDLKRFPARQINQAASQFVHNAGLVDPSDRKGTADTIKAFKKVVNQDISLLVRLQKSAPLPELDARIKLQIGNLENQANLYSQGQVFIQPSKMEGIGFMILEAVASGLPVITLDYPPMNEIVQQQELLVRKTWFKRKAFSTPWIKHAHLRLPDLSDLSSKITWCTNHDLSRISQANRQWAEQTFAVTQLQDKWWAALQAAQQKTPN